LLDIVIRRAAAEVSQTIASTFSGYKSNTKQHGVTFHRAVIFDFADIRI